MLNERQRFEAELASRLMAGRSFDAREAVKEAREIIKVVGRDEEPPIPAPRGRGGPNSRGENQ